MMKNLGGMMKKMQEMQTRMQQLNDEMEDMRFSASVGGGAVKAEVNGKGVLTGLHLTTISVRQMKKKLEELIMLADSHRKIRSRNSQKHFRS